MCVCVWTSRFLHHQSYGLTHMQDREFFSSLICDFNRKWLMKVPHISEDPRCFLVEDIWQLFVPEVNPSVLHTQTSLSLTHSKHFASASNRFQLFPCLTTINLHLATEKNMEQNSLRLEFTVQKYGLQTSRNQDLTES